MSRPVRNTLDAVPLLDNMIVQGIIAGMLDILGALTYFLPGIGEVVDILYAPTQAFIVWMMVGGEKDGNTLVLFSFAEEIIPFTDIIPSCLLAWGIKWFRRK